MEALSTYCEVVNYLLRTFPTNKIIATAYADLSSYVQTTGMTETEYGDKLLKKTIRWFGYLAKPFAVNV